jgi:hypothetical protein
MLFHLDDPFTPEVYQNPGIYTKASRDAACKGSPGSMLAPHPKGGLLLYYHNHRQLNTVRASLPLLQVSSPARQHLFARDLLFEYNMCTQIWI